MVIKNIQITNFRSYYGKNSFNFKDGLTLIIGDNGDGKTTFFEALEWLFDTTSMSVSASNMSEMRKSEMEVGEQVAVSVSVAFEHDGDKMVEKSYYVEKKEDGRFIASGFSFKGYNSFGSERVQVEGKFMINTYFDAFIRKYSMFKGESDLNVFDNPTALKELVAKFSDLKQFEEYVTCVEEFEHKSNTAYMKECKSDDKISKQAKILESSISTLGSKISQKKTELRECETSVGIFSEKIEALEKNQDLSEKYHEIQERIKVKEADRIKLRGNITSVNYHTSLLDKMWVLCPFPQIYKEFQTKISQLSKEKRAQNDQYIREQAKKEGKLEAIKELRELSNGKSQLPWYLPNEETMEEMINDEICKVCGREAKVGSDAYKFMCEKLDTYRQHIQAEAKAKLEEEESVKKELFPNKYIDELHAIGLSLSGGREQEIAELQTKIKERIELTKLLEKKIEELDEVIAEIKSEKARLLIKADGISEEMLEKSFKDIKGYFDQKEKASIKAAELEKEIEGLEAQRNDLKEQMQSLTPSHGQVKVYRDVHWAFEQILRAFKGAKEKNLTAFLTDLENKANEYQQKLNASDFYGVIKLVRKTDDSVKIRLVSSNGTEVLNPAGSQLTTMYMSVLFAISDLTSIKRKQNYPLIFDAATSSFGDTKENDFYNIIDNLDKQCIIVTKDFISQSGLNMDAINKLTCSVYRIKKADGFDPRDLSTIRTIVESVKE